MNIAIITGASRGLGKKIAEELLKEDIGIISVARSESTDIKERALENKLIYEHFPCDLSSEDEIIHVFGKISSIVFSSEVDKVFLFNNAGLVEPIETVGKLKASAAAASVKVNLLAPILITNLMLEKANQANIPFDIVNITSGAAEKVYQGWSVYGSTKAGLNMFTKTAASEQDPAGTNNRIVGYSPGVMDTNMQETIRSSSKDAFQDIERFQKLKEEGNLRDPQVVAEAIVKLLLNGHAANGEIYHVNDLLS
ncbi:(S)-benzoin forming benzil reductase [Falsibacillus albus]|uniref:(S)-benzoin forming benzil reductase n=1 Tax=Falsibacillus albus TaxID=2478915 RepID=A0A3L7K0M4_9BACI|nr:(S)-benzoin forming benzil reductase [Falsibacillus albus]RLQ96596.1 (S)-benzoin forming benzil reductase [Falsibacillus albus]